MGTELIEEILEGKIIAAVTERLNGVAITVAGFWNTLATGDVRQYAPPLLTVALTPVINDVAGVARFKTTCTIVLTIPRSKDGRSALMVETCRTLLPYINSFAGLCNQSVKAAFSNTETAPFYTVTGILDNSSDSSFHRESDNWVVVREFTVSLVKNT